MDVEAAIARNRLEKVAKVRASAAQLRQRGDAEGAATLERAATANEHEVWAAQARDFDIIPRRKWTLIAEWLGSREDGQRTARWFRDETTGVYYVAESWKRPNLSHPLNAEQVAYVESVIG